MLLRKVAYVYTFEEHQSFVDQPMKLRTKERVHVYLSIICLTGTAVVHLAFGATSLVYGRSRVEQTGNDQPYTNQLPTAAFAFITAIVLLLYCSIAVVNLLWGKESEALAAISWTLNWVAGVMSFGVGVLTANQYSLINKYLSYYQVSNSLLPPQFITEYNCLLADAILSFGLGLPASMVLMGLQNRRRAWVGDISSREVQVEKKEYRIQERISEGISADNSESSNSS